jgi:hypothetical protein
LKPLSNGCLGIIIKINLTTNYQLLLNCYKVHRAMHAGIKTNRRSWLCNKLLDLEFNFAVVLKKRRND